MPDLFARRALLVLVFVALGGWVSAQHEPDLAAAPRISMADFKALHAAGKVVVIDTRSAENFAQGHIPGALNLPLAKLLDPVRVAELKGETRPIVIYCA